MPLSPPGKCTLLGIPLLLAVAIVANGERRAHAQPPTMPGEVRAFVQQYCLDCHNRESKSGDLDLAAQLDGSMSGSAEIWERVVRKLNARQMPPADAIKPQEDSYVAILKVLTQDLDGTAVQNPKPGRTDTFRRLTRTEYRHSIRDLLALDVDASELLPADESSHGFDNITVGELSPTLIERYLTAAQKISRLALGKTGSSPGGDTFRIRPDVTQEEQVEGLPLGTRGGLLIPYNFPVPGKYDIEVRLARDRDEHVEGLHEPHTLLMLVDRRQAAKFSIVPPRREQEHATADAHVKARLEVPAGPHKLGVTFLKNPSSLLETKRQPYQAHFNRHRHPRLSPAVYQVSITGPYEPQEPGRTPSREQILFVQPKGPQEETACAKEILTALARRAFRREVTTADLEMPLNFYRAARQTGDFDDGIELALSSILINPNFLFRVEVDPPNLPSGTAYQISDLELATRLSFFLWSSIPDEELLEVAIAGKLHQDDVLRQQVRRMLADEKAEALTTNFADQWLYLRNLDSLTPDLRLFPDFDDNLRQAMRRETELLFDHVLRQDRSVLELLSADYTFLNERLAQHYGIPHVRGSRFRQVDLSKMIDPQLRRGGLLRQGSILTVTSYATRTSPVIRGHWILKNLLGTPPPPPPANVPALEDNTVSAQLSVRERLAQHRANQACAGCHNLMDPVGFALENFDAVGRWRDVELGKPIDASGGLPDGSEFAGVEGLEQSLLARPEMFVQTLTEKLLTYALGRGVEYYDAPAIRQIVRQAQAEEYRFSSLIVGVVMNTPFRVRRSE